MWRRYRAGSGLGARAVEGPTLTTALTELVGPCLRSSEHAENFLGFLGAPDSVARAEGPKYCFGNFSDRESVRSSSISA